MRRVDAGSGTGAGFSAGLQGPFCWDAPLSRAGTATVATREGGARRSPGARQAGETPRALRSRWPGGRAVGDA